MLMTRKFTPNDRKKIIKKLSSDNPEILKIRMLINLFNNNELHKAGKIIQAINHQ
jgi:hypothetical protein